MQQDNTEVYYSQIQLKLPVDLLRIIKVKAKQNLRHTLCRSPEELHRTSVYAPWCPANSDISISQCVFITEKSIPSVQKISTAEKYFERRRRNPPAPLIFPGFRPFRSELLCLQYLILTDPDFFSNTLSIPSFALRRLAE